jgi:hypothetical protein
MYAPTTLAVAAVIAGTNGLFFVWSTLLHWEGGMRVERKNVRIQVSRLDAVSSTVHALLVAFLAAWSIAKEARIPDPLAIQWLFCSVFGVACLFAASFLPAMYRALLYVSHVMVTCGTIAPFIAYGLGMPSNWPCYALAGVCLCAGTWVSTSVPFVMRIDEHRLDYEKEREEHRVRTGYPYVRLVNASYETENESELETIRKRTSSS